MTATGPIATYSIVAPGSGYTNGTYANIPLAGGHGSGALALMTVAGGTVSSVALNARVDRTGKNYQVADVLTLQGPNWIGPGSGFSVTVGSLAAACENCTFGKIVPDTATNQTLIGQRYCAYEAFSNIQPGETAPSDPYAKQITEDAFTCGDGADAASLISFSNGVNGLPLQSTGSLRGSFLMSAGASFKNITVTGLTAAMSVMITANNPQAAAFVANPGVSAVNLANGSFQVASEDGSNFSGLEGFYYLAG